MTKFMEMMYRGAVRLDSMKTKYFVEQCSKKSDKVLMEPEVKQGHGSSFGHSAL